MAKSPPPIIYLFKVALAGDKDVWRRIALQSNQTLDDLHWAIFDAFDRDDEHLYSFYFPKAGARGRTAIRNGIEYTHPYAAEDAGPFGEAGKNAAKAKLHQLNLKPRQKFQYLFDFGDSWWHEITVERLNEPAAKGKYPRVLEKNGESPPQYPDMNEDF